MTWPAVQAFLFGALSPAECAVLLGAPLSRGFARLVNTNAVGRTHAATMSSVTIATDEGRRQNFRPGLSIVMTRSWMFRVEPVTASPGEACLALYSKVSMSRIASQ